MRKILMAGLAALTLGGATAATTVSADAAPHGSFHGSGGSFHSSGGSFHGSGFHGGGFRGGRGFRGVGAGLAGFAIGAAIAGGPYGYGYGPYYGDGYYDGYDGGYDTCVSHRRVWDPYVGAYVIRSYRYAC